MSKPVIEVKNLSKRYIVKRQNKPDSLKDILKSNPLLGRGEPATHKEEFWALKDINFKVHEGETLGVVGRNGAGKSTLLKILSHIVAPTTGQAIIRGKTASLLEVGTGFHQELTGRENVFFNGALLGMSKAEIARKFTEIVEFSEVGGFIDNPVKHYSSGMRSRLAFSVAAHLDAEIMIIDEALAAGDVKFRKKATEKMKAAAFEGRSVLFVTHSMGSAIELCDTGIYLKDGKQLMFEGIEKVVETYLGESGRVAGSFWKADKSLVVVDDRIIPKLLKVEGASSKSNEAVSIKLGDEVKAELEVQIESPFDAMSVGLSLFDEQDRRILRTSHTDKGKDHQPKLVPGVNKLGVSLPTDMLKAGRYTLAMDCDIYKDTWTINPINTPAKVAFNLTEPESAPKWDPKREAIVKPRLEWNKLS